MNLPRPLVIVLIILIVLAVASCGLAVLHRNDPKPSNSGGDSELRHGSIADLFRRLAPPSEPVRLESGNVSPAACLLPSGNLQFTGGCVISIPATDALRRRLELKLSGGQMDMQVSVTHEGDTTPSDTQTITPSTEDSSVVVAKGDSAVVTLGCGIFTCNVQVNP